MIVAVARPMPFAAALISATLFLKRMVSSALGRRSWLARLCGLAAGSQSRRRSIGSQLPHRVLDRQEDVARADGFDEAGAARLILSPPLRQPGDGDDDPCCPEVGN